MRSHGTKILQPNSFMGYVPPHFHWPLKKSQFNMFHHISGNLKSHSLHENSHGFSFFMTFSGSTFIPTWSERLKAWRMLERKSKSTPTPDRWWKNILFFGWGDWYCWWKKSRTSWGWYFIPLFTGFYTSRGGAGCLPSTVCIYDRCMKCNDMIGYDWIWVDVIGYDGIEKNRIRHRIEIE